MRNAACVEVKIQSMDIGAPSFGTRSPKPLLCLIPTWLQSE